MRQKFIITLLLLSFNQMFSQQFSNLSNIEMLFSKSKVQIDSIIKNNNYKLKSKDLKNGSITYENLSQPNTYAEFKFYVTVIYNKANKLKSILWNDMIQRGSFIVQDIQNNYKIVDSKTDDQLGVFYLQSIESNLDVIIFRTEQNTSKKMMSFHLFERKINK